MTADLKVEEILDKMKNIDFNQICVWLKLSFKDTKYLKDGLDQNAAHVRYQVALTGKSVVWWLCAWWQCVHGDWRKTWDPLCLKGVPVSLRSSGYGPGYGV